MRYSWLAAPLILLSGCSTGSQPTAIILASAPNAPPHPYANKAATASVFFSSANPQSARNFFLQASYGLTKIVGSDLNADGSAVDVYGPFTTADNACDFDPIALADPAVDYKKYVRIVVLVNNPACAGGGYAPTAATLHTTAEGDRLLSVATLFNLSFGETTLNGKVGGIALHEYGHMLGMEHAGAWYCGASSVAANGCYGSGGWEPIDLVSENSLSAHPNSVHKEQVKWLPGARLATTTASGTYTLNAYEDGTDNLKVLK